VYLYEHANPEEEQPTQGQEQGTNVSTLTIRLNPVDHVAIARHCLLSRPVRQSLRKVWSQPASEVGKVRSSDWSSKLEQQDFHP
jgi:hypothetical protein